MTVDARVAAYRAPPVEQGYAVILETILPDRLEGVRDSFEILAKHQFARWEHDPHHESQWPVSFHASQPQILIQTVVGTSPPLTRSSSV